jgi:hypothetical protein
VQSHDARDDVAPYATGIGRIGDAAVLKPIVEAIEVIEMQGEIQRERRQQRCPDIVDEQPDRETDDGRQEEPGECESPCL